MADEPGPFNVPAESVTRLGASFTPVVNRLLDLEAASAGLSGESLTTTYKENMGDEGVDAGLRRATKTRWIPAGNSAWQFKAGDKSPAECAAELDKSPAALEVMMAGGSYRMVLGAALNDKKIRKRRQELEAKAKALGVTPAAGMIEVLDANALARWIEAHPTLAVSPVLGGIDTVAQNYASWSRSNRHVSIWVPSTSRELLRTRVQALVTGSNQLDLHIAGASGLGKTRAVMESFRGTPYESLVLYIHAADALSPNLVPRLLNQHRAGVVVVDDCGGKRHEGLAQVLPVNSKLRLVTIGEPDSYIPQSPQVVLEPLSNDVLDDIVKRNEPNLWTEARRVVVDAAGGNVRWALLLANGVMRENVNPSELITADAIRAFITKTLPGGLDFLACSALALFTRIGYERELSEELDLVAGALGFDPADLRAAARALQENGLLSAQGRYRSIAPHPLAIYLANVGWQEFGDRIVQSLLPQIPLHMADRLFTRAGQMGNASATASAVAHILGPNGPFSSLESISVGGNSRLLIQLSIIAPDEVVQHLAELLEAASLENLQHASGVRRDLVWSLGKLVWHSRTFEQAADALLRLALAENETYSNNATGTWSELFGLMLPGTAARPAVRLRYLERHATDVRAVARKLVAGAAASALTPHESILVSGELQGGFIVEARGTPSTYEEAWEYQRGAIKLLGSLARDVALGVREQALNALVTAIHPLLSNVHVREFFFDTLGGLDEQGLRRVRTEAAHLEALFARATDVDDRVDGLELLKQKLPATSPEEELQVLAHARRWDFEDGELQTRVLDVLRKLPQTRVLAVVGQLLRQEDLPAAYELGAGLHATMPSSMVPEFLAGLADGSNSPALVGYLQEQVEAGVDDAFDAFLDSELGQALPPATRIGLTVRARPSEAGWERLESLLPGVPVSQAAARLFGWHIDMPMPRLAWLLTLWLPTICDQLDYNAAVDFVAMVLHRHAETQLDVDPLVGRLVAARTSYPELGQQGWDWAQLAKRQLTSDPMGLVQTLAVLLEKGSLHIFAGTEESQVFEDALAAAGEQAVRFVLDKIHAGSWIMQMNLRGWVKPLYELPVAADWIGDNAERATTVASITHVAGDEPNATVRLLLDRFGSDDRVGGELAGNFISGSWTGNESDRIAGQIEQLQKWISSQGEPQGVKRWARRMVVNLQRRQATVLQEEAEEDR
jgi:hypothetical protein